MTNLVDSGHRPPARQQRLQIIDRKIRNANTPRQPLTPQLLTLPPQPRHLALALERNRRMYQIQIHVLDAQLGELFEEEGAEGLGGG